MAISQKIPPFSPASDWPRTARPKLAREVFLLRAAPPPQTIDTWERALIEEARRLDPDEPLPVGAVILRDNLQYNRPLRLNRTAAQIVAWCNGQWTVAELEQKVAEWLSWTPEQARQVVQQVLDFLAQRGMLEDARRRVRRWTFFLNPVRLVRALEYIVGYHLFHKYR